MKKHKELSKRLDKIEKRLGLNTEVSVVENELTELPEKWCIKITEENIPYLNEYLNNQKSKYKGSTQYWKVDTIDAYFLSENQKEYFHSTYKKPKDYTEITFDQFKKWVLKEDFVKLDTPKEKPALSNSDDRLSIREVQVKVTSQEEANECAEIAKACGEETESISYYKTVGYEYFRKHTIIDVLGIYSFNGKYKEISIQEYRERFGKSTEIDWSKAGQLVVNNNGYIWITTGENEKHTFGAIYLKHAKDKPFKIGYKSIDCLKESFKLCTEPITLKNE